MKTIKSKYVLCGCLLSTIVLFFSCVTINPGTVRTVLDTVFVTQTRSDQPNFLSPPQPFNGFLRGDSYLFDEINFVWVKDSCVNNNIKQSKPKNKKNK